MRPLWKNLVLKPQSSGYSYSAVADLNEVFIPKTFSRRRRMRNVSNECDGSDELDPHFLFILIFAMVQGSFLFPLSDKNVWTCKVCAYDKSEAKVWVMASRRTEDHHTGDHKQNKDTFHIEHLLHGQWGTWRATNSKISPNLRARVIFLQTGSTGSNKYRHCVSKLPLRVLPDIYSIGKWLIFFQTVPTLLALGVFHWADEQTRLIHRIETHLRQKIICFWLSYSQKMILWCLIHLLSVMKCFVLSIS